ncbi:molybdopterin-dependent oxidoreductase [Nocardioides marmoriginsengisoli]|uniref:molybdopterin-dependent oxidoreductase n=1 Tax=Nocardioides marmoriginsengisoli TaxID=661483 RepID=UPI001FE5111A|nr:molybdopterin-dependent oxidoreductase [Nocardioides marmoriginsengisoli]
MVRRARENGPFALAGVFAAAFAVAIAHLVASLLHPQSSPILAVGSAVIDATPTPMKTWAIRQFGTNDKIVLIGSVLAGTLVLALVAGIIARRHLRVGLAITFLLVALAGAAALRRPTAEILDLVPAVTAALLGPLTLWWLVRALLASEGPAAASDAEPGSSRRGFLIGSGALLLGGAVAAGAGQWIYKVRSSLGNIRLPGAAKTLPPLPAGLETTIPGITPFVTPNARFYRVDTKLAVPIVDHSSWRLSIDGMVDNPFSITYDELRDMVFEESDITLTCVSNEVGGRYVGAARWLGVPLRRILDRAGVSPDADQLMSEDVEGFKIGTPMSALMDGRNAIVAIGMNGKVLPREHGFPARLVVPGLYGFVSATKWVTRLTATTYAKDTSYWTDRKWATDAPIKIAARIDTPRPLTNIDPGATAIGGVAWAQGTGIERVEVSIDGGRWQVAELGPDGGNDYWRQWFLRWDATKGNHRLAVRAIGKDGAEQTAVKASPFPDGSSGIQQVLVNVT